MRLGRAVAPTARDGRGGGRPAYPGLRDGHSGECVEELRLAASGGARDGDDGVLPGEPARARPPRPGPVPPRRASCCRAGCGRAPPVRAARRDGTAAARRTPEGSLRAAGCPRLSPVRAGLSLRRAETRRAISPSSQATPDCAASARPCCPCRPVRPCRPWPRIRALPDVPRRPRSPPPAWSPPSRTSRSTADVSLRLLVVLLRGPSWECLYDRSRNRPPRARAPPLSPPFVVSGVIGVIRVVRDGGHHGHLSFCSTDSAAMSSAWGSGCTSSASSGASRRSRSVCRTWSR